MIDFHRHYYKTSQECETAQTAQFQCLKKIDFKKKWEKVDNFEEKSLTGEKS